MNKAAGVLYEETGNAGGEPVLMIHGGVISDSFMPLSREAVLTERYRLVWYRRPGYGGSDYIEEAKTSRGQVESALRLMDELGIERAHVIGHSGGGSIALKLALASPGSVHSLVLLEPAVFTRTELDEVPWRQQIQTLYAEAPRRAVSAFMNGADGPNWRENMNRLIPGASEQGSSDARALVELDLPWVFEYPFKQELAGRISQPVLFITGGNSRPQGIAAVRMLAADVQEVTIPEVNHSLQMVAPTQVAEVVAPFLASHPI